MLFRSASATVDSAAGGGGGAGYYGGGGGEAGVNSATGEGGGGGGGGSNYVTGTNTTSLQGNIGTNGVEAGANPANTNDLDYISPKGYGSSGSNNGVSSGNEAGTGLIVLAWST